MEEKKPRLALIAAVAENGCIGIDNKLPWYLPEDLKYFKAVTSGKAIIMGRTTFDSLGRPLPNRCNIVITRNTEFSAPEGVRIVHSLAEALALAEAVAYSQGDEEIVVIGGAQIYAQALAAADRLYLTEVKKDVAGDAFFPSFDKSDWQEVGRQDHHYEPAALDYSFVVYERRSAHKAVSI